jgi:hypothetical protein
MNISLAALANPGSCLTKSHSWHSNLRTDLTVMQGHGLTHES